MPRARTGQLIWRKTGWYARVWTVIDGEHVRVCKALGTLNKAVAKRKLARLLEADNAQAEDVTRSETFAEAARRVYDTRKAENTELRGPREEFAQVEKYALPVIGGMSVLAIQAHDVNSVLDHAKAQGQSRQSVQHLKQRVSNVFAQLRRDGVRRENPCDESEMPKYADVVIKERAVLTDHELAIYLAWEHPTKHHKGAVLERQVMVCVSRMFGGLRTGDLHALHWESFDVEHGGFTWGYAPRQKTRRPQLLEVPEMLRPFLHDWWTRAGQPQAGLVFPARRAGRRGDRVGKQKINVSHAGALRRDLEAAFKAEHERAKAEGRKPSAPEEKSNRWRELFVGTDYTKPVDFHSWRRAFAQALADADVNVQQAIALTGHSDPAVHARYLRNAGKMRALPLAALPRIIVSAPVATDTGSVSAFLRITETENLSDISRGDRIRTCDLLLPKATDESVAQVNTSSAERDARGDHAASRGVSESLPLQSAQSDAQVRALPAAPVVRVLDLLRAIDGAALVGDMFAVRALCAAAMRALDAKPTASLELIRSRDR